MDKRYLLLSMTSSNRDGLERYLYGNFKALGEVQLDADTIRVHGPANALPGRWLVVEGHEFAGFTVGALRDRLLSGLLASFEVDRTHPAVVQAIQASPEPVFELLDTDGNVHRVPAPRQPNVDGDADRRFAEQLTAAVYYSLVGDDGYVPTGKRIEIRRVV